MPTGGKKSHYCPGTQGASEEPGKKSVYVSQLSITMTKHLILFFIFASYVQGFPSVHAQGPVVTSNMTECGNRGCSPHEIGKEMAGACPSDPPSFYWASPPKGSTTLRLPRQLEAKPSTHRPLGSIGNPRYRHPAPVYGPHPLYSWKLAPSVPQTRH